jgi:7-carboxy-7-deazaguanine synthase
MRIEEIFYSLQGEGTRQGKPCAFVRLSGCQMRCRWCDTAYAFEGGEMASSEAIASRLEDFPTRLVCVTGGEPLLQPQVHELMRLLADRGYEVILETGGGLEASGVGERVIRILDLKAPGSGELEGNYWGNMESLRESDEIKIVIADRIDYDWATEQIQKFNLIEQVKALLFSPVHGELEPSLLAEWMIADGIDARLQLQQHKILWPQQDRGV